MLTENEERILEKNEKMLAIPKAKFIFIYGSLLFGVLASVCVLGVTKLIGGNINSQNITTTFIGFIFGGAFYGFFMRKAIEKNRERLLKKKAE